MFSLLNRFPWRGYGLVEAILASFMLLTAVIMSVSIFDSSLQAEASNEKRIMAALVAESALAEIRDAANNNLTSTAGAYDGRTWTDPDYPGFQIECTIQEAELAVPCTVLETQYDRAAAFPQPTGRYLTSSCLKADLKVSWADGRNQSITITEYITSFAPADDFALSLILPGGSPATAATLVTLAKDEIQEFSVIARSGGQEVGDIQFSWYVQTLTGFGSIHAVSRDGKLCQYQNAYRNFDNKTKYSPGLCFLVVTAKYQGREAVAQVKISNEP
ncbi:MAG: hypothetical protein WC314_22805 [Vulcanimicrobiota bacterium]